MKKLLVLLFVSSSLFCFSQGAKKVEIDWIPLEKAKEYSKKYNKEILIFFYKKDCGYCDKMKKEALSDMQVINLINNNFLPVKIDSRTKDTIIYNGVAYGNQQPESSGRHDWRHDFYAEVASFTRNNTEQSTTPSIVLFNNKFEKLKNLPGLQSKQLLLRNLKPYVLK
jgi:thioredoxin-related protein